jgi:hypothetical protein
LERGASSATGLPDLHRWLDGTRDLAKPELPAAKGTMTLGDLPQTDDPELWSRSLWDWARNVWAAYEPLQPLARQWLDAADRRA